MKKLIVILLGLLFFTGCFEPTSDSIQTQQQGVLFREATSAVGMPAITNFRERRMLKDILELRDKDGITTYTYIFAENSGQLIFLGETIGYGIPYATQYTSPQKIERRFWSNNNASDAHVIPQADPNGLFSPASAEGTWILMKDPNGEKVSPVYIEPRIVVSPFKLQAN